MAILHVWRAIDERHSITTDPRYFTGMAAMGLVARRPFRLGVAAASPASAASDSPLLFGQFSPLTSQQSLNPVWISDG